MSIYATIYAASGLYKKTLQVPDEANLQLNVEDTDHVILEEHGPGTFFRYGSVHTLPTKPPEDYWQFDVTLGKWLDPRSSSEKQAALYAARAERNLSFREFLFTCNEAGILSDREMVQAANRQIPPSFAEAMAGLNDKLRMQIEVTWASITTVNRMDPLLLLVAHAKNISPEVLDHLFGFVPD